MGRSGRRASRIFFIVFGVCLVALAVALNVSWIVLNWRTGLLFVFGVLFFLIIIAGVVLNTIFLVREIRKNEQHDNFINSVTHELKTPVASIRLYLETLQRREPDETKRREFYEIMLADSDRLLSLIEQVLRAGQSGPSRGKEHMTRVDLPGLIRECVDLAKLRHHLPETTIEFIPLITIAPVEGDADELKAAVSNLLDNAIKYSGHTIHIRAELRQDDPRRVTLEVRDQGIGIPTNELKRIFSRFYRIPGMRAKGTGLGLFIVSSIVKRHGGRVYAESAGAGRGSTFTMQLPLAS